jgi:hypothetical protein
MDRVGRAGVGTVTCANMQTPSRIEPLEPRIAPANVIATLRAGILNIVPADPSAEAEFGLKQTGANSFDLYDYIGAPEPLLHFTGVKAIKATLTALPDDAGILLSEEFPPFRGSISVNGVAGGDTMWIGGPGVLAGDLTFKTSGPGGSFALDAATIRGHTILKTGGGGAAELFGDLGSLNATGFTNLEFGYAADVRGAVKIISPPLLHTGVTAQGPFTHFHSNVTVIGGDGNDSVDIRGVVDGNLLVRLGAGENRLQVGGGVQGFGATTVRGSLRYFGGSGADTIRIELGVILGATMAVTAGHGENSLDLLSPGDLTSLTYRGGDHFDAFTLGADGGEFLRARVSLGHASDHATIHNVNLLSLRIDAGSDGGLHSEFDVLRLAGDIAQITHRGFESVQTIP